jgi:hypothetical protein
VEQGAIWGVTLIASNGATIRKCLARGSLVAGRLATHSLRENSTIWIATDMNP